MFSKFSRKGFTLIEILIVVAIIGILAGVVLVGLRGTGPQARDSRRAADLRQVQNGLELYYNKNNRYPVATGSWDDLKTLLTAPAAGLSISNIPQDPQWSSTNNSASYAYGTDTNGTSYVLKANLEVTDSKLLSNDIDSTTLSAGSTVIDCTDPAYCVQL